MIVSLDSFDCKKGHQIKNVVFSIIINSNSEAFMNQKANSVYKKIMKKEMARACGHGYCAKPDKNKAYQRKRNRITARTATLSIIVK